MALYPEFEVNVVEILSSFGCDAAALRAEAAWHVANPDHYGEGCGVEMAAEFVEAARRVERAALVDAALDAVMDASPFLQSFECMLDDDGLLDPFYDIARNGGFVTGSVLA